MTEFDMDALGLYDDEKRKEIHEEIREWAEEKGFYVFADEDHSDRPVTTIKVGEFRSVVIGPYGNVTIKKFASLGGDAGTIKLTENSLIVEDDRGQRSIINEHSFPIHKS